MITMNNENKLVILSRFQYLICCAAINNKIVVNKNEKRYGNHVGSLNPCQITLRSEYFNEKNMDNKITKYCTLLPKFIFLLKKNNKHKSNTPEKT